MPSFKVFSIDDFEVSSSERTEKLKNKTIFCRVQKDVKNNTWKNTRDIVVKDHNGTNEIVNMGSYDMMKTIHKGSYLYKQDVSGYCFNDNIIKSDPNAEFQVSDILYTGYTYTDINGIVFDYNNLCNLTDYYSIVRLENNDLFHPNKYERIYKFPIPIKLE
jgi:hypothetical protein